MSETVTARVRPFIVFDGEATNTATRIFGGRSTGILAYDQMKYPIMLKMNKDMFGEYWIEDEIRLGEDLVDYREKLSKRERYVYNVLTGKLTAIDSVANRFNFLLGYLTSDPSVAANIQLIGAFEGLHSRSYQYLTSTMLTEDEKEEAFNAARDILLLRERNRPVFEKIQRFVDHANLMLEDEEAMTDVFFDYLFDALIANMMLEGVYFSGAFVYFHSLARDQRMIGSNNMINLIKEDETQHTVFYGTVLRIIMAENPHLNTEAYMQRAVDFIKLCVEKEKEWANFIFDGIETLSIGEYHDYVEYLANTICRNAGIEEVYPNNLELRSKWISKYGNKKGSTRQDFFQTNVIAYAHESGESDDFDL